MTDLIAQLRRADQLRIARGQIRMRLRGMDQRAAMDAVADLLIGDHEHPDDVVDGMRISALLRSIRRVGPRAVDGLAAQIGLFDTERRVGQLTPRQRCALADLLRSPDSDALRAAA